MPVLGAKILNFHSIKSFYIKDEDFKTLVEDHSLYNPFILQEGSLSKRNKLCNPKSPIRDLIITEEL